MTQQLPTDTDPTNNTSLGQTWKIYKRLFPFARADLPWFYVNAVLLVIITATNTLLIWLLGRPFNLLGGQHYEAITWLALLFLGVVLINQAGHFVNEFLIHRNGARFIGRLRGHVFRHLLDLHHPQALRFQQGDILTRLSEDIYRLNEFIVKTPLVIFSSVLTIAFYVSMLFWIHWQLALLGLALSPLFYLHQRLFSPPQRKYSQQVFDRHGHWQSFEHQSLGHLLGISSFTAGDKVCENHSGFFHRWYKAALRQGVLMSGFNTSLMVLIYITGTVIVAGGIYFITQEQLRAGQLVSFLIFLGYLSVPVQSLAQLRFANQGNLASGKRVEALMQLQPFVESAPGAPPLQVTNGDIRIDQVSFHYAGGPTVFDNISISIESGETVGLVGPSGSGKSTFAQLITRYFDPDQGRIKIDGQDIRDVDLASLRRQIAVCWQQGFFMADTIRNNLLLAKPDAGEQELIEACQAAQAWEFIRETPDGLNTLLQAGGLNLSAGQGQRLNLAQVLLKNSPILILDEVSSALDSETEKQVSQAIEHARHDRTTLMIAHRHSSLRFAHRVIYFNGDGSVTVGDHSDLYQHHAGYKQAVDWQMGG